MSVSRDLFDLRIGGLYLPSLVLIIVQPEIPALYLIIFGGLCAAVFFHGLIRSASGIGGPEKNPMKRGDAIQSFLVAMSGKGPHDEMPDSPLQLMVSIIWNPLKYGPRLIIIASVGVVLLPVWTLSAVLSLRWGIPQFGQLSITAQLLIFAELVWILQWVIWRFFTPAYYLDEDDFR